MKELQYKTFSFKAHEKNRCLDRPNVCQFELTFQCGLHCRHCYSDCFNKPKYWADELKTDEVKSILDEIYQMGVPWLCLTGGDPFSRDDFLDIYSYARAKGFIISIFTSGFLLSEAVVTHLRKSPPFVIELTLNAVSKELYENISQVNGSFEKVMRSIALILEARLPLKIKTQVTKDNLGDIAKVNDFVSNLGLAFNPSFFLHARLNGDLAPCDLRISPQEALELKNVLHGQSLDKNRECQSISAPNKLSQDNQNISADARPTTNSFFNCVVLAGDGLHIDPYGNMVVCNCIRQPRINVLKADISQARLKIRQWLRTRCFVADSECSVCSLRGRCFSCPGKSLLEKGSLEEKISWFCQLAQLEAANL